MTVSRLLSPEDMHPDLVAALTASGWFPGRSMDVRRHVTALVEHGFVSNPFATGVLEALLDLRVEPLNTVGLNFSNSEPLLVDPLGVGRRHRPEAVEVEEALGEAVFPIGWWLGYSYLYVTSAGRVVAFSDGLIWLLGSTPVQGLDMAIRASAPLRCVGAREGQRRWPPVE